MHWVGHVGAALLAYTPVGAWLAVAGHGPLALVGGAVMVALATLPDGDQSLPFVDHRGVTHTVGFALVVGVALGSGWFLLAGTRVPAFGAPRTVGWVGFLLGTLSVLVHVAADAVTPMGVRPFWPVSRQRYSLAVIRSDNRLANFLLFGLGVVASTAAIWPRLGW